MANRINIDFQILSTFDPKVILVVDTSDWQNIESKPSIIEILLPGETKPVVHYFDKGRVNIFNSMNLGITCSTCLEDNYIDLPDGIYHFTVKGSPDTFNITRQYLKTDKTRLELDKYVTSVDLGCEDFCKDFLERYSKINLFLEAAEANTRLGDYSSAQDLLFRAQKLIRKLKGCNTCV